MVDIVRAFSFPEKYAENLPMDRIVADDKVEAEGVSHYHDKFRKGHKPAPIIVVKHPKEDIYAVLDGHHRFSAMKEMGAEEVRAVVIDSYIEMGFNLTKKGVFQPDPILTKYVRMPFRRFTAYMKEFMEDPWQKLARE